MPLPTIGQLSPPRSARRWMPKRVAFTKDAYAHAHGRRIAERVEGMGVPVEVLKGNRLNGLRGKDEKETYRISKNTFALKIAPPGEFRLTPIPPSADWQFHLAKGCPAHCQYCYLAGSLTGPPVIRAFANLPEILDNTKIYVQPDQAVTTYEASCYTDPLGIEHLTGSLARTIEFFGQQEQQRLRWVTKYDDVDQLLPLAHNGHTRCRISLNTDMIGRRLEGGTANIAARIQALRKLALPKSEGGGGYPIGIVLAPIMPLDNWQEEYAALLDAVREALDFEVDLTFELISHRFTPGSKNVLLNWYPHTPLDMEESTRSQKRNKFGGVKFVYPKTQMTDLKGWFHERIGTQFPEGEILYWT